MCKILKTILLLFIFSNVFGQNKIDYSLYHDKILHIEELNAQESFDSSIVSYSDIFSKYNRVMARDAFNACQIAALKKHKYFQEFFLKCAQSGISKKLLLKNHLIRTQYLADSLTLSSLYSKGSKDYLSRIDTTLRNEMIQRADNEQKNKGTESYSRICTDNFNRILELSKKGKFPGESIIGNSDDIASIIFPTLCHYPYSYTIMEPFLNEAIQNGDLTGISLIYLYGFNQTRKSILYTSDIPVDSIHFKCIYNMPFGLQSDDFDDVNKQRAIKKIYSLAVQKNLKTLNSKFGLNYLIGYY